MGETAERVRLDQRFDRVDEHWSPKIIATLDDYDVKIAKIEDPVADETTEIVMLEPHGALNTGDADGAGTAGEPIS